MSGMIYYTFLAMAARSGIAALDMLHDSHRLPKSMDIMDIYGYL